MHLQGWHLVIIIVLALLLFAGPKLPKLARSLGQSMRIFKSEVRQMKEDDKPNASSSNTASADEEPVEGRVIDDGQTGPRA